MQNHGRRPRPRLSVSGEKRKVISGGDPLAKDKTGEQTREPSGYNRASPTELGLRSSRIKQSPRSHRDSDWHAQADQERDELGKLRPCIAQHAHRMAAMSHSQNPRRSDDPHQQSGGHAPNKSRTGSGCPAGKEEAEGKSEKRAVYDTLH